MKISRSALTCVFANTWRRYFVKWYNEAVIRRQGYRFRLNPIPAEEARLRQFLGCSRFVWNAIVAENESRHEQGDPLPLNHGAFCARLKVLKARHPFLREVHSQPLQQTLRDLAGAYQRAFDPKLAAQPPTFKKKASAQGIRFPQGFKVERNGVYLPKIGWVAFRVSKRTAKRSLEGEVKNVTVRLEAGGWYVSFQTEREVADPVHQNAGASVGVDLGVARFAALSDGTFFDGANAFKQHELRLARLQRRLARKVRFSANWRKAKARITRLHSRIANIRKDQLHKASAAISKNHAIVVLEDLRIINMTASAKGTIEAPGTSVAQKRGLNRRILDQGWGEFRRQLGYKLAWRGGILLLVDPRNTSRTCSACGRVSADNRRTQSVFVCTACGYASNADSNAANNILGRAGCARIACGDPSADGSMKQEAQCAA
jgi:putative transposase